MGWFDDQGIQDYGGAYEQGGITGGQSGNYQAGYDVNAWNALTPEQQQQYTSQGGGPPSPEAQGGGFNPNQQVGHDGTINGMNREQYRDAWMSSGAKSMDDLRAFTQAHGGTIQSGNGSVMTPFGESLDMGINARGSAAGNGVMSAGWGGQGGGAPAGGSVQWSDTFGQGGGPSALAAATGVAGAGGGGGADYTPKSFDPFQYEKFDPASVDVTQDPGYAFRVKEGQRAMQNSAAAKGTLLTGGFAKALTNYGQEAGSQEYGNAFNRAFGTNQANNAGRFGAWQGNINADLGYGNLALGNKNANNSYSLGLGNLALGNKTADQNFFLGQGNLALGNKQADNSFALGNGNLGLGWANFGLNADGQNFNQGFSLANMGQNSAVQQGNFGNAFANNSANNFSGAANAQGGAAIARGNAWANTANNIANNAIGAFYAQQYGGRAAA